MSSSLPEFVPFALGAAFFFALGGVLQKHGIASQLAPVNVGELYARRREVFAGMRRNRVWLLGLGVTLAGSPLSLQAVSLGDVSAVKPLMRVDIVFAALLGVALLRERLALREWLGVASLVAGAFGLVGSAARSIPVVPGGGACALLLACALLVVAGLLGAHRRWPGRVPYETAAPLGAGLLIGFADVAMKLSIESAGQAVGGFDVTRAATFAALATTPYTWLGLCGDVAGFVLVQTAYSRGRVAVIAPVTSVSAVLFTVALGHLLLGESLAVGRAAAIAAIVGGAGLLFAAKAQRVRSP